MEVIKRPEEMEDLISSNDIALLYFSTYECNVCKTLKPKVKELVDEYDIAGIKFAEINQFPELSGKYSVFTVPTIIMYVAGKETARFSRNFSMNELIDKLDRYSKLLS